MGQHSHGGLNIVDIYSKERALKASWIPRLLERDSKNRIVDHVLERQNLTFELVLKMNFRKFDQFCVLLKIPKFYANMFIAFNYCKYIKPIYKLNNTELLSECLWGNDYFKVNGKTMFLRNWLKSGFIFVKDLLNDKGGWLDDKEIFNKLQVKVNWISELMMIKKTIAKFLKGKDMSISPFIQNTLLKRISFVTYSKIYNITYYNASTFYAILRDKKYEKPYTEKMWERILNLQFNRSDWSKIYLSVKYKKLSEFRFKIIHNILPCGKYVSTWNKNISPNCIVC